MSALDNAEVNRDMLDGELFGRLDIYSNYDTIDESNIISAINYALTMHVRNIVAEEYLYWYRRCVTPVLWRKKEVRPEINNKVNEGGVIAGQIVDFKNGYFLTQPAFYVARNEGAQAKVRELNEFLYRSGKTQVDNKLADWFHTVGKAALYVDPKTNDDTPIRVYALDPRSAFVVYSLTAGNRPVLGVNMVVSDGMLKIDAYTEKKKYTLIGRQTGAPFTQEPNYVCTASEVVSVEPNPLGKIPIIEYKYNSVNMGAFENVISLLDALSEAQSNRIDGLSQQIQNLLVLYNCELAEGTTANTIRQNGLITLKSVGDNKADVKDITTIIDQAQNQVLVDDLYERILAGCAMPSTTKGGTSTSDTGAAVLARDGWYQADAAARDTEDLFKESNRLFDEIFISVLKRKNLLDIEVNDFELNFVRNETANAQSKAQCFNTLMSAGLEPTLALAKSGVSNDPVADYALSEKWIKQKWGDPEAPPSPKPEQEMVKETDEQPSSDR